MVQGVAPTYGDDRLDLLGRLYLKLPTKPPSICRILLGLDL